MKAIRPLLLFFILTGTALAALATVSIAEKEDALPSNSEQQERYVLNARFLQDIPPLLADGKKSTTISIRVLDSQKNKLKPLEFAIRTASGNIKGTITEQKRKDDYVITYTTPDLRGTNQINGKDVLYAFYLDDEEVRKFQTVDIALSAGEKLTISKKGFLSQTIEAPFKGPMSYIQIETILPDGNMVPVNAASVALSAGKSFQSDTEGLAKVANPNTSDNNEISEVHIVLQPEENIIEKRRQLSLYYKALNSEDRKISDPIVWEFITMFEEHLAKAETEEQANKLITGLNQVGDLLYVLNRGMITSEHVAHLTGKAARNQLWESLDHLDQLTKKADTLSLYAKTAATDTETQDAALNIDNSLKDFPRHYLEIISSLSGASLSHHSPTLNSDLVNGFFAKVIELAAGRKANGTTWDDSWFEKAILDYFQEYYQYEGQKLLAKMADMIRQHSFPLEYKEDLMREQKSLYEDATATYLQGNKIPLEPVITKAELNKKGPQELVSSPETAYLDFVKANEESYDLMKERFYNDQNLASWLFAFDTLLSQTRAVSGIVMLQEKDSVSANLLLVPPAFADGQQAPDETMKKVTVYRTSLIDNTFYKKLATLGEQILPFDENPERLQASISESASQANEAAKRSRTLALELPRKFQIRYLEAEDLQNVRQTTAWRVTLFATLLIIGMTYMFAPMLLRKPVAKQVIKPVETKADSTPPPPPPPPHVDDTLN